MIVGRSQSVVEGKSIYFSMGYISCNGQRVKQRPQRKKPATPANTRVGVLVSQGTEGCDAWPTERTTLATRHPKIERIPQSWIKAKLKKQGEREWYDLTTSGKMLTDKTSGSLRCCGHLLFPSLLCHPRRERHAPPSARHVFHRIVGVLTQSFFEKAR